MRFYLDEMFSPRIAAIARARGSDVTSSHESGQDSSTDDVQLLFAAQEGRCVVTRNYDHFIQETLRAAENGDPHAEVLLVPNSLLGENFATIAAAIVHFDHLHPDGLPPYTIMWLSPAPP
jgi:predicted nuclease of predicted toxin-antitoxin system